MGNKQEKSVKLNVIMRWILFGVVLTVAPAVFKYGYHVIVGFNDDVTKYFPDILLAVIAVSCNFFSYAVAKDKEIFELVRWLIGIFSFFFTLLAYIVYFLLLFDDDFGVNNEGLNQLANPVFYVVLVIIVIDLLAGCLIEFFQKD